MNLNDFSGGMAYLKVSLSQLQGRISVRALDGALALHGNVLGVAGVLFCKAEESLDGLLVVLVTLHFDDHFLQAPDGLLSAFLRHLALEVVVQTLALTIAHLSGPLLILLGDVLGNGLFGLANSGLRIEALFGALTSLLGAELSYVGGIS
jgi:hypothetical protein